MKSYKTFDQWSNSGYKIKKGAKAKLKIDGTSFFHESQVEPSKYNPLSHLEYDGDYDEEDYIITNYELCIAEWGD